MNKLPPNLSGLQVIKILCKIGFEIDHQTGSHIILRHKENVHRRLTVPNHREVSRVHFVQLLNKQDYQEKSFSVY